MTVVIYYRRSDLLPVVFLVWLGPLGRYPQNTEKIPKTGIFVFSVSQWAKRDTLMSRGKYRRETIFVSQLSRSYPRRGGNFERGKIPFLVGERQLWRHFRRQFGREQLRVKNCRETVGSQSSLRDIKVSRGALWDFGGPVVDSIRKICRKKFAAKTATQPSKLPCSRYYPKHLSRQKKVNNLARLFFTLRNKKSLARLFPKVILRLF